MFRKVIICALAVLFTLGLCTSAYAVEFGNPDSVTGNYSLSKDKSLNGNLVAAGNNVDINGSVSRDLVIAGNMLSVTSVIGNNAFMAGNSIVITDKVKGDVFTAGANVKIDKNAVIDGSLIVGASNVKVDGEVKGDIYAGTGILELNGKIGGKVNAGVGTLIIGPSAEIAGKVTYSSQQDAKINSDAKISGGLNKQLAPQSSFLDKIGLGKNSIGSTLVSIITILLFGVIFLTLFPQFTTSVADKLSEKLWASLGWGILTLIGMPIVIILSFVIIVGLPIGLVLMCLYFLALYMAKIFVGLCIGRFLSKDKWLPVWSMTVGILVLVIIGFVPYINSLVNFVVLLVGLGSVAMVIYQLTQKKSTK